MRASTELKSIVVSLLSELGYFERVAIKIGYIRRTCDQGSIWERIEGFLLGNSDR